MFMSIRTDLLAAFESSELTYEELAKRTNLPKSALYRYLNGDTEKIPIDRFQAICEELHVDAAVLLGWKDPPANNTSDVKPQTIEAKIIADGVDQLPPDQREQALNVLRAVFSQHPELFKEERS